MSNLVTWKAAQDAFSVFVIDSREKIVADVRSNQMRMSEHLEVARLIAASPEMYEALYMVSQLPSPNGPEWSSVLSLVLNALRKAEGKNVH